MESWFRKTLTLSVPLDNSDRVIEGIATAPIYDRVGELITTEAVKKAMDDFMVLPVLTCGHQDFPVGKVIDYWFGDNGELHVKGVIKKTASCDDVWRLILDGKLNAFSISGRRTSTTCTRTSKSCVTDGLYLYSIALCGDDKCNPAATFNIVKSLLGDENMTETNENQIEEPVVQKSSTESPTAISIEDISSLLDQKFAELSKSVKEDKEKEETKEDDKEDVKKTFEAYEMKLAEFTEALNNLGKRIETIENTPITKGSIVIDESGNPHEVDGKVDPYIMAQVRARLKRNLP